MLDRNSIIIGLLIGFLLPFVGYAILLTTFEGLESMGWVSAEGFSSNFRERTMAIVAIALNIYPLNTFLKRRFTNSMRGIVIATTVYVITWLVMYGSLFF